MTHLLEQRLVGGGGDRWLKGMGVEEVLDREARRMVRRTSAVSPGDISNGGRREGGDFDDGEQVAYRS